MPAPLGEAAAARRCRRRTSCAGPRSNASAPRWRRAARSRRLHPGGAAVLRGRRGRSRGNLLRQCPRDRGLVGRCRECRPEDGGAAGGRRRARARYSVRSAVERRRALIYGTDERAVEAGKLLADHLDITVLISRPKALRRAARHRISGGEGHHQVRQGLSRRVRDHGRRLCRARAVVARRRSRSAHPAMARSRAAISCSISPAARRCFPRPICATAICAPIRAIRRRCCVPCSRRAISSAPSTSRATSLSPRISARIRAQKIVGCHRCLDLCPPARSRQPAITSRSIRRSAPGCGQCAAACPTGAAAYALPPADTLMREASRAAHAYREAGGTKPIVLLHDDGSRRAMIDALARHGDGLPANVLPLAVNEVTQVGLEASRRPLPMARARCVSCCGQSRATTSPALRKTIALAEPMLAGLGFGGDRVATIETDDPGRARRGAARDRAARPAPTPASFMPPAASATCCGLRFANCIALRRRQPTSSPLPEDAPFGAVEINVEGCTLCLVLRVGLPDRRASRRHRTADAALHRGCLRAVRAVPGDLPGEGHHAKAADRLPRRHGRARVLKEEEPFALYPLQQAVRRQKHDRACLGQARGQAWMFRARRGGSTSSRCARTAAWR